MRVAYIGNFEPPWSTENEVRRALESEGHEVSLIQENDLGSWKELRRSIGAPHPPEMVLWTRTWSLPNFPQCEMLDEAQAAGIPTVGFHLDRWWGLDRQVQVESEPFFCCSLVVTADGGHDAEWAQTEINHHWLPPAVSHFECGGGEARDEYRSDVAFVGSWLPGYHAEWTHRPELVSWLRANTDCRFWPPERRSAIRGEALRDLYASVKVVVGDSCLVGGATAYWSDRIPETLGRGGFLLHPDVVGLDQHFTPGEHLVTWPLGDWSTLGDLVRYYLDHDKERQEIAAAGRDHVLEHHTYAHRVRELIALVK